MKLFQYSFVVILLALSLVNCKSDKADSASDKVTKVLSDKEWLISDKGIGPLVLGSTMNPEIKPQNTRLNRFNASSGPKGKGLEKASIYSYQRDGEIMITVGVKDESIIESIEIVSDDFDTAEGAHSGMTVRDIMRLYPTHDIWYEYETRTMAITSPAEPGVQFIIDKLSYKGGGDKLGRERRDVLEFSDFDPIAVIEAIRLGK